MFGGTKFDPNDGSPKKFKVKKNMSKSHIILYFSKEMFQTVFNGYRGKILLKTNNYLKFYE